MGPNIETIYIYVFFLINLGPLDIKCQNKQRNYKQDFAKDELFWRIAEFTLNWIVLWFGWAS